MSSGVARDIIMTAVFDRPLDPATLTVAAQTFKIMDSDGFRALEYVVPNGANTSVLFKTIDPLKPLTDHSIFIVNVKDTQGRQMTNTFSSIFLTNDVTP